MTGWDAYPGTYTWSDTTGYYSTGETTMATYATDYGTASTGTTTWATYQTYDGATTWTQRYGEPHPQTVRIPVIRPVVFEFGNENKLPTNMPEYVEMTWEEYQQRRRQWEPNYNQATWTISYGDVANLTQEELLQRQRQHEENQAARTREWEAQRQAREEAQRAEAELKREAIARARELLLGHLDNDEKKEFLKNSSVTVKVGGAKYRVRLGRAGNIDKLKDDGSLDHRLCVHVQDQVPDEDNMLAQLLFLKTDPEAMLSKANHLHY